MDANECNQRASDCAANAAIASEESVAQEFLKLAAQWRAMAVRNIFIGRIDDNVAEPDISSVLALPCIDPAIAQ